MEFKRSSLAFKECWKGDSLLIDRLDHKISFSTVHVLFHTSSDFNRIHVELYIYTKW